MGSCQVLLQKAMHFNVTTVSVKENEYRNDFWYISKDKAINTMKHFDLSQKNGPL